MNKFKIFKSMILIIVIAITIACSIGSSQDKQDNDQKIPEEQSTQSNIENVQNTVSENEGDPSNQGSIAVDTPFPVTDDAKNIISTEDSVNFQTGMSLDETVEHYRQVFKDLGLSEDSILTSITDSAYSMVFRGSSNGKSVVIQGVDLGDGNTNISIRYEDV